MVQMTQNPIPTPMITTATTKTTISISSMVVIGSRYPLLMITNDHILIYKNTNLSFIVFKINSSTVFYFFFKCEN